MTDTLTDLIKTTSITSTPILLAQLDWLPWIIQVLTLLVGLGYIVLKLNNEFLRRKNIKK